jgi:hypothetical protein
MIQKPNMNNMNWQMRQEARNMLHSGPVNSIVPGRTDRHNVHVASGSYVMPADAVSHLGQNNTKAGQTILGHMFGHAGPYGAGTPQMKHGSTMPHGTGKQVSIPGPSKTVSKGVGGFSPGAESLEGASDGGGGDTMAADNRGGGQGDRTGEPVPVVVAGGEFTITPEAVAKLGGGDVKRGHRILDKWVMELRKKHIATLKGLPPPVKS